MAEAQVIGKVGVCTVHQGPGVTNTLTALTESVKNRTPRYSCWQVTPQPLRCTKTWRRSRRGSSSVGAGVDELGLVQQRKVAFGTQAFIVDDLSSTGWTGTWTGISSVENRSTLQGMMEPIVHLSSGWVGETDQIRHSELSYTNISGVDIYQAQDCLCSILKTAEDLI